MEENVANNTETTKLGGITGKGFMPGVSGNPGGRPKNSLKLHLQTKFADMDDEQKEAWLKENKINAELMWRMAEGNPSTNMELSGEVKAKIISVDE